MDQSSDLRRSRVRKFLITHGILCGLAFLMTSIETLLGAQAEVGDIVRSYLVSVIAGAMTVAGFALYHRPALTNVIAPRIRSEAVVRLGAAPAWEAESPKIITGT